MGFGCNWPTDGRDVDKVIRGRNAHDDMYEQLLQLSCSTQDIGAMEIGRATGVWKAQCADYPLYAQVLNLLLYRGNEQE